MLRQNLGQSEAWDPLDPNCVRPGSFDTSFSKRQQVMAEVNKELVVYECPDCFVIIPYRSCFHNCCGIWTQEERNQFWDMGYQEQLDNFYEEVWTHKNAGYDVIVKEANGMEYYMEKAVVLAVPDQPGKVYKQKIEFDKDGETYHLLCHEEDLPSDVEPIYVVEVEKGGYQKLDPLEVEELQLKMSRVNLADLEDQPDLEPLFEERREPY